MPKARARVVRKGGRTWSFTPKKVAAWEGEVRSEAERHFERPFEGPVALTLVFHLSRPDSRRNERFVSTTPDLDNLEKAILDALNGVAYEDDRLVAVKSSTKLYVRRGEPGVSITVTSLSRQSSMERYIEG